MAHPTNGDVAVACDLSDVSAAQRRRHREVREILKAARREVRRGETAWTVVFDRDVPVPVIGEFVEFERRCCRFLAFDICGRPNGVCLELGGPDGALELIAQLFDIVSAPIETAVT